jgi:hypothetical protein
MQCTREHPSPPSIGCFRWELRVSITFLRSFLANSTAHHVRNIGSIRTVHTHGTSLSRNDRTPLGIAIEMKRKDLYEVLKPVFRFAVSEATLKQVEAHFHRVIRDQMSWPESGRVRLPKLGVLREGTGWGWFPVSPGVNRKVRYATIFP